MNRGPFAPADSAESLQTDVMRFMAILGFCLMAILALVRNVDSLPAATPAPTPTIAPPVVSDEAPARPAVAARALEPPVHDPAPLQPAPKSAPPAAIKPTPRPSLASKPAQTVATSAQPSPTQEEPLVLRFASDTDFLKLVSNGVVEVYAYDAVTVLKLAPGFAFAPAARPPQVRQLLEDTIPALVRTALARSGGLGTTSGSGPAWGVRLPPAIEASIQEHLKRHRTGALLIDRNGSVRHVASS